MIEQRHRLNGIATAGLFVLLWTAPAAGQTAREVEDVFWRDVVCERELEVRAYLETYPDGAYVSEARACLEQGLGEAAEDTQRAAQEETARQAAAADDAAYAAAEQADTAAAYGEYLEAYPAGRHADVAQERSAARQEAETFQVGRTFRDALRSGGEGPEMVVVPAGSFQMGSPSDEGKRERWEGPVHRVTIGAAFAVGVYEVTRAEYERFVEATRYAAGKGCDAYYPRTQAETVVSSSQWTWQDPPGYRQSGEHPVVCINRDDAEEYVAWLSWESRAGYRLLSEAEWEYVARGGTETARYWGKRKAGQCRHANGADVSWGSSNRNTLCNDGHARTAPVGVCTKNGFGLSDVLGNVWELIEDCWNSSGSYAGAPTDGTAWEQGDCDWAIIRGGSWSSEPRELRSASRRGIRYWARTGDVGFRVARSLTP